MSLHSILLHYLHRLQNSVFQMVKYYYYHKELLFRNDYAVQVCFYHLYNKDVYSLHQT